MTHRSPVRALVIALVVLAGAAAVAVGAYQAGVAQGVAEAGRTIALPPEASAATHIYVMPHPWHWGFFPVGPVFGLLVAFLLVRALLWGGCGRRGGCHGRFRDGDTPPDATTRP